MSPDIGLANWFYQRAQRTPERKALTFEGVTWTYREVQRRIDALAGRLRKLGVHSGDRVAFLGLNQPLFLVVMFAAARLGAAFVPLNFRLTGPELVFIANDAGACAMVVDTQHRGLIDRIRDELTTVSSYLTTEAAGQWLSIEGAEPAIDHGVRVDPDAAALIMYTSGTTGTPKGAILTHANLWWNNINAVFSQDASQDDVTLAVAPLFHIAGLNAVTLLTLQKGGEVVLHRSFDPGAALAALSQHRVSTMFGVPAMFQSMAQHPNFEKTDLSAVRMLICGGAPCPMPLLQIYEARGIAIQQGYGLTETAPMCTFLSSEYSISKLGSSGRPPLFTELRLAHSDGSIVTGPNIMGEIQVRGPNVMLGYWNRPDATAEVIDREGWFRTGDIGYTDDEGFLYVCDRLKDMIISGGENIYPAEVESALSKHLSIAEVAVIGVPDDKWGEAVTAVVTLKPGSTLTLEELRDFASKSLGRYKMPRRLELIGALPRNAAGKVLKTELRRQLVQAIGAPDAAMRDRYRK